MLTGWQGPHCLPTRIVRAMDPYTHKHLARPQAQRELCSCAMSDDFADTMRLILVRNFAACFLVVVKLILNSLLRNK